MELFSFRKLNEDPLGEIECLSNLYYFLAAQVSSFCNLLSFLEHSQLGHTW